MPFGVMTRVGPRYYVLNGGPDPIRERVILRENVNYCFAHCKLVGHSTVSCAKTADPIDMPFWKKTSDCL